MTIQDDFNNWLTNYRNTVPRSSLDCLVADLAILMRQERSRYEQAHARVNADIAAGEPRKYGKPRLRLTPPELVSHMQAREERAKAHQRLAVLKPLARRVKIARQQWASGRPAPDSLVDAVTWLMPLTMPYHAGREVNRAAHNKQSFGYGTKAEREMAAELVRDHPLVFYKPGVAAPVPAQPSADSRAARKEKLRQKILDAVQLTAEERLLLADALR